MRLGVWTGTALRYVLAALAPVGAVVLGDLILWRAQGLLPAPPGHGVTLAIAILRFLLAVAAVALSGRIAAPGRPMHFVNVLSTAWGALFVVDLLILRYALPGIMASELRGGGSLAAVAVAWLIAAIPGAGFAIVWWLRRNSVYQGIPH